MAVRFIIANSPSSRLCWLTPKERHQRYHLLSYFHLVDGGMKGGKTLRRYIKKESKPEPHGKLLHERANSPPVTQRIKTNYIPNYIITEKGLPPRKLSLRDAIERCLREAGKKGCTGEELVEAMARRNIKTRVGKLTTILTSMKHKGVTGNRGKGNQKRFFLSQYMTAEEEAELQAYLKKNRAIVRKKQSSKIR